jgi:hypothetical protein
MYVVVMDNYFMYHDKLQGLTEEGVGVVWYNKATVRISFGGKSWYHQQLIQCYMQCI